MGALRDRRSVRSERLARGYRSGRLLLVPLGAQNPTSDVPRAGRPVHRDSGPTGGPHIHHIHNSAPKHLRSISLFRLTDRILAHFICTRMPESLSLIIFMPESSIFHAFQICVRQLLYRFSYNLSIVRVFDFKSFPYCQLLLEVQLRAFPSESFSVYVVLVVERSNRIESQTDRSQVVSQVKHSIVNSDCNRTKLSTS